MIIMWKLAERNYYGDSDSDCWWYDGEMSIGSIEWHRLHFFFIGGQLMSKYLPRFEINQQIERTVVFLRFDGNRHFKWQQQLQSLLVAFNNYSSIEHYRKKLITNHCKQMRQNANYCNITIDVFHRAAAKSRRVKF